VGSRWGHWAWGASAHFLQSFKNAFKAKICRVYTCRFNNQIPNGKFVKKYFLVVKLAQYLVSKEDRKLALYCKQETRTKFLKLGKLFFKHQVLFLVVKTA